MEEKSLLEDERRTVTLYAVATKTKNKDGLAKEDIVVFPP